MEWAVRELKILWVEKILASGTRPAPQVRVAHRIFRPATKDESSREGPHGESTTYAATFE